MAQLFHLNSTFLSGLAFVFQFVVAQHFCQLKTGESQEAIGLDDWRHLCVQCLTEVVSPSGVQRCGFGNRWGGGNGVLATVETWIDSISRWKCQHEKWRVEHLIATPHSTTRFFLCFSRMICQWHRQSMFAHVFCSKHRRFLWVFQMVVSESISAAVAFVHWLHLEIRWFNHSWLMFWENQVV